jgi:RNA polymerase sigma factor (TIGR02999 family)
MPSDAGAAAPASVEEVTRLLQAWGSGDETALARLRPVVYSELHRLAHRYMAAEPSRQSLQTTVLLHEVYHRLVDVENVDWPNRARFYGICARSIRRILIDFARSRNYQEPGGHFPQVELGEVATVSPVVGSEILAMDEALKELVKLDARRAEVVELRCFGGLTVEETAALLRVSSETVMRDWKMAKARLLRELNREVSR